MASKNPSLFSPQEEVEAVFYRERWEVARESLFVDSSLGVVVGFIHNAAKHLFCVVWKRVKLPVDEIETIFS